jgi:hypothetical protein
MDPKIPTFVYSGRLQPAGAHSVVHRTSSDLHFGGNFGNGQPRGCRNGSGRRIERYAYFGHGTHLCAE